MAIFSWSSDDHDASNRDPPHHHAIVDPHRALYSYYHQPSAPIYYPLSYSYYNPYSMPAYQPVSFPPILQSLNEQQKPQYQYQETFSGNPPTQKPVQMAKLPIQKPKPNTPQTVLPPIEANLRHTRQRSPPKESDHVSHNDKPKKAKVPVSIIHNQPNQVDISQVIVFDDQGIMELNAPFRGHCRCRCCLDKRRQRRYQQDLLRMDERCECGSCYHHSIPYDHTRTVKRPTTPEQLVTTTTKTIKRHGNN